MPRATRLALAPFLLAAALSISGCKSAPALDTPSGRPEVTLQGQSGPHILKVAREFFIQRGYASRPSDNADKLIFDRRIEKPGTKPSPSNCWRIRLTLVDPKDGSHRLMGIPAKVDDCGSELESEHVMPSAFPQIQALLQQIKAQLEFAK